MSELVKVKYRNRNRRQPASLAAAQAALRNLMNTSLPPDEFVRRFNALADDMRKAEKVNTLTWQSIRQSGYKFRSEL